MTVKTETRGSVQVVHLSGNLDGTQSESLGATVSGLTDSRGAKIVLDLTELKFINSTGLSELVTLTAQANARESRILLANPTPFVAGVLETTRLDRFFDVCPSVDAAVARLQA